MTHEHCPTAPNENIYHQFYSKLKEAYQHHVKEWETWREKQLQDTLEQTKKIEELVSSTGPTPPDVDIVMSEVQKYRKEWKKLKVSYKEMINLHQKPTLSVSSPLPYMEIPLSKWLTVCSSVHASERSVQDMERFHNETIRDGFTTKTIVKYQPGFISPYWGYHVFEARFSNWNDVFCAKCRAHHKKSILFYTREFIPGELEIIQECTQTASHVKPTEFKWVVKTDEKTHKNEIIDLNKKTDKDVACEQDEEMEVLDGRPNLTKAHKKLILDKQEQKCGLCGTHIFSFVRDIDHVVPRWMGGWDDDSNFWALCRNCHGMKCGIEAKQRSVLLTKTCMKTKAQFNITLLQYTK